MFLKCILVQKVGFLKYKALIPYKIHLSYRMFGSLRGTAWFKREETWKIFCRS